MLCQACEGSAAARLQKLMLPLEWSQGQAAAGPLLRPSVYFSPRRSSAPDTAGGCLAEAAAAGAGAVAGAGAAWLWAGGPGAALDADVMRRMQRLLMPGCGRLRVFGGSRFDTQPAPAPEWEAFGSHYFMLPRWAHRLYVHLHADPVAFPHDVHSSRSGDVLELCFAKPACVSPSLLSCDEG